MYTVWVEARVSSGYICSGASAVCILQRSWREKANRDVARRSVHYSYLQSSAAGFLLFLLPTKEWKSDRRTCVETFKNCNFWCIIVVEQILSDFSRKKDNFSSWKYIKMKLQSNLKVVQIIESLFLSKLICNSNQENIVHITCELKMCSRKSSSIANVALHCSHWYESSTIWVLWGRRLLDFVTFFGAWTKFSLASISTLWTFSICSIKLYLYLNVFLHWSQGSWTLTLGCFFFIWFPRTVLWLKVSSQTWQE